MLARSADLGQAAPEEEERSCDRPDEALEKAFVSRSARILSSRVDYAFA